MLFAFANLRRASDGHGWEPDVPEGVSCLLLADVLGANWALYRFRLSEGSETWRSLTPVNDELKALIYSAMRYPPALALARNEVRRLFSGRQPTHDEFADAYGAAIRRHLIQQGSVPFALAQATEDEDVDLTKGEWYWVVGVDGDPPIASWVSDDYFIYRRSALAFDLTEAHLARFRGDDAA